MEVAAKYRHLGRWQRLPLNVPRLRICGLAAESAGLGECRIGFAQVGGIGNFGQRGQGAQAEATAGLALMPLSPCSR